MKLLLDSCSFLWLIGASERLTPATLKAIRSAENGCWLSVASLWEILVKHASGRLEIDLRRGESPERFLVAQREHHGIASLAVDESAVAQLPKLPPLHRDPFDRLLICQAIAHGLVIVTPDDAIRRYPVRTLWE